METEVNRKSDGQGGPPVIMPNAPSTASGPNAALKEPPPAPGEGYQHGHPQGAKLVVLDGARGLVGTADGSPLRKKIAICGFASSTRAYILELAKDPAWEIWGLNQLNRHIPRADRWFDIHWNWDQEVVPGTDHRKWAQECGIPFYTIKAQADLPTNVVYPIDAIIAGHEADYFTSTIAYELALAIWEIDQRVKVELRDILARWPVGGDVPDVLALTKAVYAEYTIALFGIDLTVGTEYFHEKPCAEYWLGGASARGISVQIPPESALCKQRFRYGYERHPESLIRLQDVNDHKAALEAQRNEMFKRMCMLEGAIECDTRWEQCIELRERGTVL